MDGRYVKLPPIQKKRPKEDSDEIARPVSATFGSNVSQMVFREITATDLARHLKRQEEDVDAFRKQLISQQQLISRLLGNLNKERHENLRLKTENDDREKQDEADDGKKTEALMEELEKTRGELNETEAKLKEKNSELISATKRIELLQKENKEKDETIAELQSQVTKLQSTMDEQQKTIDDMNMKLSDYSETKSELAAIREQLNEVMAFQNSNRP